MTGEILHGVVDLRGKFCVTFWG